MLLPPRLRKLGLTVHVVATVGWAGALAAFLALAIAGLTSRDPQLVRSSYPAMDAIAWLVIVPLAGTSLITGFVQSLGAAWGLFRHYWVAIKLGLTLFAAIVLLLKLNLISQVAGAAAAATWSSDELLHPRLELAVHAAGGLVVLIAATALAIYNPRGVITWGC